MRTENNLIPDTLELTDRAELAIRHMTTNVDHKLSNTPYFYLHMAGAPPGCSHEPWDWGDVAGRYVDALVSLRQMTGSRTGKDIEETLKDLLLSTINKGNGLTYRFKTPWSNYDAGMFDQGRTLSAFLSCHMATGAKKYLDLAAKMVDGLWSIATHVHRRDKGYSFCYYPYSTYMQDGWDGGEIAEPTCYGGGATILPVVKFYEISGSPRARDLAERFINFIVFESGVFDDKGGFLPPDLIPDRPHFHSKSLTFLGILKFAILEKREDLFAWSKMAWDWAYKWGTSFGWFPEGVGSRLHEPTPWSETCCTIDMIETAILLAQNGFPEYWNHVERFARNYLMESQIVDIGWILVKAGIKKKNTRRARFTGAPEMMLGGFVGRSRPHDLIADGFQMACCCGAGARGMYQVWDNAMKREGDSLYINLLLNKRTPFAEIQSYLPHEGKVLIKNIKARDLYCRIPDWVSAESVSVSCDDKRRPVHIKNGFLHVPSLKPANRVVIRFPVRTEKKKETVQKWTFDILWRGDAIVRMNPTGDKVPLYQREYMNTEQIARRSIPPIPKSENTVHW
jgi:DUF1680 family protein